MGFSLNINFSEKVERRVLSEDALISIKAFGGIVANLLNKVLIARIQKNRLQ